MLCRLNFFLIRNLECYSRRCLSSARPKDKVSNGEKSSNYSSGETHFGFETVKEEEKSSKGRLGCMFTVAMKTENIRHIIDCQF